VPEGVNHVYHQYAILIDERETVNGASRDRVREVLSADGIGSGVYYPTPLHLNPLFSGLGYGRGSFPVAEATAQRIVALPIHPLLAQDDIESVAAAIRRAVGAKQ
jgi:dTDP-4-amino-4,6-dideoxygalactose transaminase